MNMIANRYDAVLKPFKLRFVVAALLLLSVAVVTVSQMRTRRLLENKLETLTSAQSGLVKVKAANANLKSALTVLQTQFSQIPKNSSPEMVLYSKTDEIKSRLNPDEMAVSAAEKKGGEATLQYDLTFNNPDFNKLLNDVSYLHGGVFPLTPVNSLTVSQSGTGAAEGVSFKISGRVISIEKSKP